MTHNEAVKRLMELAQGRYSTLGYRASILAAKPQSEIGAYIRAYIEGVGSCTAKTYLEVINEMEDMIEIVKIKNKRGANDQEPPEDADPVGFDGEDPTSQVCKRCKNYGRKSCPVQRDHNETPGLYDWCAGYKAKKGEA